MSKSIKERIEDMKKDLKAKAAENKANRAELKEFDKKLTEEDKLIKNVTKHNALRWQHFVKRYGLKKDQSTPDRYWIDAQHFIDVNLSTDKGEEQAEKQVLSMINNPKVKKEQTSTRPKKKMSQQNQKKHTPPAKKKSQPIKKPKSQGSGRPVREPFDTSGGILNTGSSGTNARSPSPQMRGFMDGPGLLDNPNRKRRK